MHEATLHYHVADLVDIPGFERLMHAYYATSRIPIALLDADGQVLSAIGWQEICTHFHRACPATKQRCQRSDVTIRAHLQDGPFYTYQCENGLTECAAPIIVGGHHVATLFLGQFFHEPPDEAWFARQARDYGFDEQAYLDALRRVLVIPREQIEANVTFVTQLAQMLASTGLDRLRQLEARELLQQSEANYRRMIEMSPQPIVIHAGERFIFINDAGAKLFGAASAAAMIGMSIFDVVHPAHRAATAKRIRQEHSSLPIPVVEEKLLGFDGREIDVILSATSCSFDGQPAVQTVLTDITALKQTEQALRESEERFKEFAELLPQLVFELEGFTQFSFMNRAGLAMSGYAPDDLEQGLSPLDLLVPHDRQRACEHGSRLWRGERVHGEEYTLLRKDGTTFPVMIFSSLMYRENQPVGARGIIIDISDWKRAEEELRQHRDHLEDLVALRTSDLLCANEQLRSEVAEREQAEALLHQYQERLRALATEVTLVGERERRRIAQNLHDQIGQSLFAAILRLGKVQQQCTLPELHRQLDDIRRLLDETISSSRSLTIELSPPVLYELGFTSALRWLAKHFTDTYDIPVTFQEGVMEQSLPHDLGVLLFGMVRELLYNVIKHACATRISLRIATDGRAFRVTVEDDGQGFDPATVMVDNPECEGFGLFSIRERLQHFGGVLHIASSPHRGTQIALLLPLPLEFPVG